uniref:Peroxisomal acyl-coenzyme A oxidase 1 n=1 Tax=Lygus hesperus TaxID=30085 RepID=A0A0A9YM88_LYGHE
MLARYQYVDGDGNFHVTEEKKQSRQLHYATMMFTRGSMVKTAGGMLARAATIATRYSCIRQQGYRRPNRVVSYKDPEVPIIDHYIQRYRVCKYIALTYALKCAGSWLIEQFQQLENSELGVVGGIADTSALTTVAATTAGLKGLTTLLTCNGIEDLRKSCGGNGYLLASGIGALSVDYVWQTTAEGDFIILLLQTARF